MHLFDDWYFERENDCQQLFEILRLLSQVVRHLIVELPASKQRMERYTSPAGICGGGPHERSVCDGDVHFFEHVDYFAGHMSFATTRLTGELHRFVPFGHHADRIALHSVVPLIYFFYESFKCRAVGSIVHDILVLLARGLLVIDVKDWIFLRLVIVIFLLPIAVFPLLALVE